MSTPALAPTVDVPAPPAPDDALFDRPAMVNPYVRMTICGGNEVMIKHGSRSRFSQVVRDDGKTKLLGRLLRALGEPATLRQLEQRQVLRPDDRGEASRLLSYLIDERIVISPDEYLPHVYLSMRFGAAGSSRLQNQVVGLAGAGALGSRIAEELATFRLGGYALLDNRPIAVNDKLGDKVSIIDAAVHDDAGLRELFSRADLVVAALEGFSPSTLHAINRAAIASRKPWISAFLDGSEAVIGPLYVPGDTLCYNEFEIQNEAAVGLRDDFLTHKETLVRANGSLAGDTLTLSPFVSVVSGWASTAALSFMSSGQSFLVGRCLRVDFERFAVDYQELMKLPRCPACASLRADYRHTFL